MDDPSRIIEPHEFGDFRKELLQVLQEVKQEANSRDPHNGDELDPSKYRLPLYHTGDFRLQSPGSYKIIQSC